MLRAAAFASTLRAATRAACSVLHLVIAWGCMLLCASAVAQQNDPSAGQIIVHMLDYVGVDYPDAVEGGKIKNADEFSEMVEFSTQAVTLLKSMPPHPKLAELVADAQKLAKLVADKASAQSVADSSGRLRWAIIAAYSITVAPKRAPDLARGAALYARTCAACHGDQGRGDGPAAAQGLDPPPSNFHDAERMASRSIYGLYNTVTLGVTGTSMPAFKQLSEDERWDLAFFAAGIGVPASRREQGKALWEAGAARTAFPNIGSVATLSAREVVARHGDQAALVQDYLRATPAALAAGKSSPIAFTRSTLEQAVELYRAGQHAAAQQLAVTAYLEGFELVEAGLDAVDANLRRDVETQLIALRSSMRAGAPVAEVQAVADKAQKLLERADEVMTGTGLSPTAAAFSSFVILVREGLEAILVLGAIISFLTKAGRREALPYIHAGWIGALVLGIVTWFVASYLITISGAGRELTEGISALLAAAVLIYVGFWLHGKAYAQQWRHFIDTRLKDALAGGALWALAGVSFLAVYREVFETVLFYQALWAQAGENGQIPIVAGFACAAAVLATISWALFRYGIRMPIAPFFAVTSTLMALLGIVLAGKGVSALQEAGHIGVSAVDGPQISWLGIYPTTQSLTLQAVLLAVVIAGFGGSYLSANRGASRR